MRKTELMLAPDVARLIHFVRDQRVILDADLAGLYDVPTKRLNEQYRRNLDRFPEDFAFRVTPDEWAALRSQVATSSAPMNRSQFATGSQKHRDPRYLPIAFTEHGALSCNQISKKAALVKHYNSGRYERGYIEGSCNVPERDLVNILAGSAPSL
jgi:hypothetical protein